MLIKKHVFSQQHLQKILYDLGARQWLDLGARQWLESDIAL
jgi:hypothetical protein